MATRKTMRQELEELRQEFEALRKSRSEPKKSASGTSRGKKAEASMVQETVIDKARTELSDLETAIEDLAKAAEGEIADRPVVSLAVAFLMGLAVGRLLGR
jgi:ElaB/YqjD/DUF883 family membrane-anchored ribosome-binding protein